MGLVSEIFTRETLKRLPGRRAIGHVRYSTAGSSELKNAPALCCRLRQRRHRYRPNGNLTNASLIAANWSLKGRFFQSTMDTEVIVHLLARSKKGPLSTRPSRPEPGSGAYSLLFSQSMKWWLPRPMASGLWP